jgi:hypothetical protein
LVLFVDDDRIAENHCEMRRITRYPAPAEAQVGRPALNLLGKPVLLLDAGLLTSV